MKIVKPVCNYGLLHGTIQFGVYRILFCTFSLSKGDAKSSMGYFAWFASP